MVKVNRLASQGTAYKQYPCVTAYLADRVLRCTTENRPTATDSGRCDIPITSFLFSFSLQSICVGV